MKKTVTDEQLHEQVQELIPDCRSLQENSRGNPDLELATARIMQLQAFLEMLTVSSAAQDTPRMADAEGALGRARRALAGALPLTESSPEN